jgi:hypothetical protein
MALIVTGISQVKSSPSGMPGRTKARFGLVDESEPLRAGIQVSTGDPESRNVGTFIYLLPKCVFAVSDRTIYVARRIFAI